ncbi:MAG: lipocalin-like domain-containing protein [Bacteroidales bacterium]
MNKCIKTGICLVLLLTTSSCSKNFDDRLRGQWQLQEYSVGAEQVRFDRVFYKFSRQVLQISAPGGGAYGQFFQEGDSLFLELPDHDKVPDAFRPFGWSTTREHVEIRSLSRQKLELSQGTKYWHFRKF